MHPLRPIRSLFHPAIFISMLGQAAIHIACMTLAVQWATEAMGPDKLKEVTEFFKKAKVRVRTQYAYVHNRPRIYLSSCYLCRPPNTHIQT